MKINSCDNHVLYERHYVSVSESDESSPYDTRGKDGFFDLIGAISLEGLLMPEEKKIYDKDKNVS